MEMGVRKVGLESDVGVYVFTSINRLEPGGVDDPFAEGVGLVIAAEEFHVPVNVKGPHVAVDSIADDPVLSLQPGNDFREERPNLTGCWLGATVEVLKGELRDNDVLAESIMPILTVFLEFLSSGIIPVDVGNIPVAIAATLVLEVVDPFKAIGIRGGDRGHEPLALLLERCHGLPPDADTFINAQISLTRFIRLVGAKVAFIVGILGVFLEVVQILPTPELRAVINAEFPSLRWFRRLPVEHPASSRVVVQLVIGLGPSQAKLVSKQPSVGWRGWRRRRRRRRRWRLRTTTRRMSFSRLRLRIIAFGGGRLGRALVSRRGCRVAGGRPGPAFLGV